MESSDGAGIAKALWQMGARIPLGELTPFLKGALRMESSDGVTIAKALRYMGATLPPEDLPQTLRGVLRLNSADAIQGNAKQGNAKLLQEMGATLPHEELADELRGALRTDSYDAIGRVIAIMKMGVTLPPVELPEFLQLAVAMQSPADASCWGNKAYDGSPTAEIAAINCNRNLRIGQTGMQLSMSDQWNKF